MNKAQCLDKLNYVRDAFWFSLGGYGLATSEETKKAICDYCIKVNESDVLVYKKEEKEKPAGGPLSYQISFSSALGGHQALRFVRQTFHYMIVESFEAAQSYAINSGKKKEFREQDWHAFARHLRNAIGHNCVWNIHPNVTDLPTTFRNRTISFDLNGQPLGDFVGWFYGLQLCANIIAWVSKS